MKNKEIDFSILKDSESLPNDIKVSESEKERIFKMTQKMYDMKKKSADTNYENTNETSGVEVYRRPKWYRAVSFVAAFVIAAAGIGGSTLLMMNMRNNPNNISTQLEDETEPTESEESEEATEPEIVSELNYDMSTKDGIYNKMVNSIDFYDRVSGRYIHGKNDDNDVGDFSVDLNTCETYTKTSIVNINNLEEALNGMPVDAEFVGSGTEAQYEIIYYCDGELFYWIHDNHKDSEYREYNQAYESDPIPFNEEEISFMKEWFFERRRNERSDGDSHRMRRRSPLDEVTYGNDPSARALLYLSDFDEWEITGEQTFIGRDCIVLEGNITLYCELENSPKFTMYVDKETGFVLKFIDTELGELKEFFVYQEIFFDDDAEMVFLDLDQYETVDRSEPEKDDNMSDDNSKVETYGAANVGIYEENYDELPDLIAVAMNGWVEEGKEGYMFFRKDEFFNKFINGDDVFVEPSDTAVEVELNIYDQEGEFYGTLQFYSKLDNIK